jgi:hypothetical protein
MIVLSTGTTTNWILVRQDVQPTLTDPVYVLRFQQVDGETNSEWCQALDASAAVDTLWRIPIAVVNTNADANAGEVILPYGNYIVTLYEAETYTYNLNVLTAITSTFAQVINLNPLDALPHFLYPQGLRLLRTRHTPHVAGRLLADWLLHLHR